MQPSRLIQIERIRRFMVIAVSAHPYPFSGLGLQE